MKLPRDKQTFPLLFLSAAIVALCLYARWRLLGVPFERDEGEYAYMGQLLLQGVPPYLQAYTMKLPGVSAVYAFFMVLFGQSVFGVHLGLLLVNLGGIVLTGLLARRLFNPHAALAAAAGYALLSVSQGVFGVFAHATHFVVLFALAGFLLLLRHLDSGRLPSLLAGGVCLGLAITMKQHAVFLAAFALLYYLWRLRRRPAGAGRQLPVSAGLFALAMAAPLLLLALALALAGVFPQFWFWTVRYASGYASSLSLGEGVAVFSRQFPRIAGPQFPLWLLAAAGAAAVLARPRLCRDRLLLFGLLVSSFLAICPGFYFREHYFVLLLPVVALLIGAAAAGAGELLAKVRPGWLAVAVPCLLVALAAGYGIVRERVYLLQMPPQQVSRAIYGANPFPESLEVARYLRERTTADDRIAVLGSEPQIYFYAGRRSATGHLYMYGLMEDHRDAGRMQREMIAEIEAARPKYLVFVNVQTSWLARPQSPPVLFDWLDRYLPNFYETVGAADIYPDRTVYNFDLSGPAVEQHANSALVIFRRKE